MLEVLIVGFLWIPIRGEESPVPEVDVQVPVLETLQEMEASLPQGFVSNDFASWIPQFKRVEVVVYDHSVEEGRPLVDSGRVHPGVVQKVTAGLSDDEVERLKKLVTGKHRPRLPAWCYEPHHGFIFYDGEGNVVGHIEICFSCRNYRSDPPRGLSADFDLDGLKDLILAKGLPVLDNADAWEAYFAKNQRIEQAGTEQPATSPEQELEGSDKPQPEAEGPSR
jgi:hypothetical protein